MKPRVRELDGIRGTAILLVMGFHFLQLPLSLKLWTLPALLQGWVGHLLFSGWVGVDLFFVLSGFLITGILWESREEGRYFRRFYTRRFLRIFPAYYLGLVTWALVQDRFPPSWLAGVEPGYQRWLWGYGTDLLMGMRGPGTVPPTLGHLWSLALEEQFYLLWPLLLFFLSRQRAMAVCLGLLLARPLSALVGLPVLSNACRVDSIAAGCLLALLVRGPSGVAILGRGRIQVAALSSAAVVVSLFLLRSGLDGDDELIRRFGFTPVAIFFASLLGLCLAHAGSGWLVRGFSLPPLRWFGKHSYALYLVHQPVCLWLASAVSVAAASRTDPPSLARVFLLPLGLSLLLALVSWYCWERWFLALKPRLAPDREGLVPLAQGERLAGQAD